MTKSFFVTNDGEWLAGEARKKDVEVRNILWIDFLNVSEWFFPKIAVICLRRFFVPFRRKDTLAAK